MTCTRCNKRFGRFVMEPHQAFSFGADGNDFADDAEIVTSCKECLTDEEVETMLAPAVYWVLSRLMGRANAAEMPGLNFARALMAVRSNYEPNSRDVREFIRG